MIGVIVLAFELVLLHRPGGGEVWINPKSVTTMHAGKPGGESGKYLTGEAKCLLNTTDGKFISVIELCSDVRAKFEDALGQPR